MTERIDISAGDTRIRIAGDNVVDLRDVLAPPRFRETRTGDIFAAIKDRLGRHEADDPFGDEALSLVIESYTMHGCQGILCDPRDGELYRVLVAPADSAIWGRR